MVSTRTGNYSPAPSLGPRSKNCDIQGNAHSDTPDSSVRIFRDSADSGLGVSFAPIAQEPVKSSPEENGGSQQTLNADLPSEVETAKPTPLQGTQSTEPRSQESDTGLAESPPGESRTTTTSTCEDVRVGSISQGVITASAAPQLTDLTPQEPEISDLAPREAETAGCGSPQETQSVSLASCETETETADLAGCQEPEAASFAPHETAPQDPETADRIRPPEPELANPTPDETADTNHYDTTNVNPLTIAALPLPKLSTADVEPPEAADLDVPGTKTTDPAPLQEPQTTNVDHHETNDVISPKIADPLQEPQAAHSVPQDNRRSNSEEAGPALLGSQGDTNENPIVLDDSTAGDSRFNPIEIPDDPITRRIRKRKHNSDGTDGSDGRYKLQSPTKSHQRSRFPFVPWAQANLYL